MMNKLFQLIRNPRSEYKKIAPFLRTKFHSARQAFIRHRQKLDFDKLRSAYSSYYRIKLHFGCGPRVLKGWINIDLHHEPFEKYLRHYGDIYPEAARGSKNDFYALNITKTGLPLPDNSVDVIFHEDFIEHLDQKEQIIFLAETLRVLKPGAVHRVNTPDLLATMQRHSDFKKGAQGVYEREWDGNGHKSIFTPATLKEIATLVGYSSVVFNGRNQSISRDIPPEYRPGIDRSDGENIFADLIK